MSQVPALDARVAWKLGQRLRQARQDAGLTQEQAAHAAGISRNHLQVIEQGMSDRATRAPFNPHLSLLLNLCRAVQIDLAHLVLEVWGPIPGIVVEYEPTEPDQQQGDQRRGAASVSNAGASASGSQDAGGSLDAGAGQEVPAPGVN